MTVSSCLASFCPPTEAGPDRGAEEVHRETPVPHPDAGDHPEDAGQRLGAGGRHQEDQGPLTAEPADLKPPELFVLTQQFIRFN